MVEEISEQEAREQIETNLFGALWVTQAVLPYLREQGSGHILQVSSIGGITASVNFGMYHASKWALEGISQSLALEVADFGIKVTIIEPGGFSTDWEVRRPSTLRRCLRTTICARRLHVYEKAGRQYRGIRSQLETRCFVSSTPRRPRFASSLASDPLASQPLTTSPVWRPGKRGSLCLSRRAVTDQT